MVLSILQSSLLAALLLFGKQQHFVRASEECVDTAEQGTEECQLWAATGECQENPEFMNQHCQKSCGICGDSPHPLKDWESACADVAAGGQIQCREWAWHGECETNPEFMHKQCRKSCGVCTPNALEPVVCEDVMSKCEEWAGDGLCVGTWKAMSGNNEVDSAYVAEFCPKSCGICDIHLDHRDLELGLGLPQYAPDIDDKGVRQKVKAQVAETRKYIDSLDPTLQEQCKMAHPFCARFALSTDCTDNEEHDMFKYYCAAACQTCERFFDLEERTKAETAWYLSLMDYKQKVANGESTIPETKKVIDETTTVEME